MTQQKKFAKSQPTQFLPTQGDNIPDVNPSVEDSSPRRERIKHLFRTSPFKVGKNFVQKISL
jgi:hypothetical protein